MVKTNERKHLPPPVTKEALAEIARVSALRCKEGSVARHYRKVLTPINKQK